MPIVKQSRLPFADTVATLSSAITASGATLFASIDQAAAARGANLTLRPTTLLVFGNPKSGTPLMTTHPLVALELPLKILVWEEDGLTQLAYTPMAEIAPRYAIDLRTAEIEAIDRGLETIANSVAA